MKKITMLNITLYMVRGPPSSKDISITFFQLRFCWTKGKELRACCANTLTPNVQLILVTTYACASAKLAASMCRSQTRRSNNIAGAVPIWFNTSCLKKHAQTQSSMAAEQKALNCYEGHAEIVVEVAFQPIAQGGPKHFVSGNGHIVCHAREIHNVVDADSHPPYVAHLLEAGGVPAFNREEAWTEFMEEAIGLKIAHRGDWHLNNLYFP